MSNTTTSLPWTRRYLVAGVALLFICITFAFSRYAVPTHDEQTAMASRFGFTKHKLLALGSPNSFKSVRAVHPELERISSWISSLGAGVSLWDLDNDGLSNDLCLVDPRTDLVSVMPAPGTPERYTPFALDPDPLPYDGKTTAPMGTRLGDFNADGAADILVYYWGRTPILFMRHSAHASSSTEPLARDQFTATELTPSGERWFTNAVTQGDLDGDGRLDLIIGNYFKDGGRILDAQASDRQYMHEGKSAALNGGRNRFFLGKESGGLFQEVDDVIPDEMAHAWTLASGVVDLDDDQLPEIYFSNDFGPDWLLHNRSTPGKLSFAPLTGKREFTKPKSCVLGYDSFKGMGCDFADLNGDGFLDIYVSNIATRFGLTESHFVWMSTGQAEKMKDGEAPYVQESESLGLSRSGWGWDCRFADFDNDGIHEAIQACGFVKGTINRWPELQSLGTSNDAIVSNPALWPTFQPGADLSGHDWNPFFVRDDNGRYTDLAPQLGIDDPMVSKGIAIADVNGDGHLDFAVANQWEDSFLFLNRSQSPNQSLVLHVLLPVANHEADRTQVFDSYAPLENRATRVAVGAMISITAPDGKTRVAHVDGGAGHSGQRSPEVHFGLGQTGAATLSSITVRWRDSLGRKRQWPAGDDAPLTLKPGHHWIVLGNDHPTPLTQNP